MMQVQKIRKKLAEHGLTKVTVGSTEEFQFQAQEYIAMNIQISASLPS